MRAHQTFFFSSSSRYRLNFFAFIDAECYLYDPNILFYDNSRFMNILCFKLGTIAMSGLEVFRTPI